MGHYDTYYEADAERRAAQLKEEGGKALEALSSLDAQGLLEELERLFIDAGGNISGADVKGGLFVQLVRQLASQQRQIDALAERLRKLEAAGDRPVG